MVQNETRARNGVRGGPLVKGEAAVEKWYVDSINIGDREAKAKAKITSKVIYSTVFV